MPFEVGVAAGFAVAERAIQALALRVEGVGLEPRLRHAVGAHAGFGKGHERAGDALALVRGGHVQGLHEVVLPVHHADHLAVEFRHEEGRAALVDVAHGLAAVGIGLGGLGRELRQPGAGEGVVEDGLHRVEVGQAPGPDGNGGGAHRSTASISVSLISSITT
ncbi:hypothetical protein D9M68_550950 [compost metagenome]